MPTKAELYAQMADKVATQLTGSWQYHLRFDVPLWTGAGTLLRPRRFHGDL